MRRRKKLKILRIFKDWRDKAGAATETVTKAIENEVTVPIEPEPEPAATTKKPRRKKKTTSKTQTEE